MNHEELDNLLRHKMEDMDLPSTHHLWSGVASQLPVSRRRRRPLALWLLVTGVAGSLAMAGWYHLVNNNSSSSANHPKAYHSSTNHSIAKEPSNTPIIPPQNDYSTSKVNIEKAANNNTPVGTPFMHIPGTAAKHRSEAYHISNPLPYAKAGYQTLSSTAGSTVEPLNNWHNPNLPAWHGALNQVLHSTPALPATYSIDHRQQPPSPVVPQGCYVMRRSSPLANFRPFVEIAGGGFMPIRLGQPSSTFTTTLPQGFSSSLAPQPSLMGGLMAGAYLAPQISLKSGLLYSRWAENLRYSNPADEQTITIITIKDIVLPTGEAVSIRDTVRQTITGKRTINYTNIQQRIEVPIIAGFEFGRHTRFTANAGVLATLATTAKGIMLDSAGKAVPINPDGKSSKQATAVGMSLYAGMGLMLPVSPKATMIIEPHARLQLQKPQNQFADASKRQAAIGIQAALRYKF